MHNGRQLFIMIVARIVISFMLFTKIVCKPSCSSRTPLRKNVFIFENLSEAEKAGFHACKRCQPGGHVVSNAEWVTLSQRYLQINYQKQLTLEDIANEMHVGKTYFEHVFRVETGSSVMQYLHQIRLNHGKQLLRESTMKIKPIALRSGFKSANYFSRAFKKYFEMTPSEYRKSKMKIRDEIV